jgi:hypothetical protein
MPNMETTNIVFFVLMMTTLFYLKDKPKAFRYEAAAGLGAFSLLCFASLYFF